MCPGIRVQEGRQDFRTNILSINPFGHSKYMKKPRKTVSSLCNELSLFKMNLSPSTLLYSQAALLFKPSF